MSERIKQIAQAAGLVMAAYVVSRSLGLVREMVIARQFGTSAELGAYLAAFRVPDFIFQLLAGGALGSSLIPVLSVSIARRDADQTWRLTSAIYNLVTILTTLSAVVAFILAKPLTQLLVPGYSPDMQLLTQHLMRIMLVTPIIFGVSGISMAVLNAHQHFLLPALAPILYNISIILGAALLAPLWGVQGLAIGVAIGSCLHLAIQLPGLGRQGLKWFPTLGFGSTDVAEVIKLLIPRMLGLAVMQINFFVSVRLASNLSSPSLPALNYAFLLMMLPQGVFAMAIATAAFPAFSNLAARAETDELRRTLASTLRAMLFLSIPAAIGLFVLRQPLIRVLLQGGQFTDTSTDAVAWALQFYVIGLPAYAIVEILSRAFYALHDTWTPVLVAAATVLLNIALSLALIGVMDIGGLALANAIAVNLEMFLLLGFVRKRLDSIQARWLWDALQRIIPAASGMALALTLLMRWANGWPTWLVVIIGMGLGSATYVLLTWLLGLEETRLFGKLFLNRVGRKRPAETK